MTAITAPAAPIVPPIPRAARSAGLAAAVRFELVKLLAPWRTRILLALLLVGPAAFVLFVSRQGALPSDTVFGRWMHQTGWAGALVVLGFCCSWVLPLLVSFVAGDVFSSEDRLGTWRHLLMAVRSPSRIVVAKVAASLLVLGVGVVELAASGIVGGLLGAGNRPLVGLDGQTIPTGHVALLVLAAWAYCGVAALAWAGVGFLGSVVLGRSPVALLLPALVAVLLQMLQLLQLPLAVRLALPSSAFLAWRGLFTEPVAGRSLVLGLVVALAWAVVATGLAHWLFARRDFATLANDGTPRRALLGGLVPLVLLTAATAGAVSASGLASGQAGDGVTQAKVEQVVATSFAHLYVLQTAELQRPAVTEAQLRSSASCDRGGDMVDDVGAGNDWRCVVTWHLPGATATGSAVYQLDISPDGRIVADGDGPNDVNGYYVVHTSSGMEPNPMWQVDGLVDLLTPR